MELSTIIPIPSASPPSVNMFNVSPVKYISAKVEIIAIGIDNPITTVARTLFKNSNNINTEMTPPINILIGGVISVFILLLFLKSVRATVVIGLSIPIAIISTFALMYFTGETLNILTLGGLALGIGMMVDSSIVILENIYS